MEDKIGVFICTGYGIGGAIDTDALCQLAVDEYKIPFCEKVDSCQGPDLNSLIQQIKNQDLTKAVIAGISSRGYAEAPFPEDVIVETIPLQELVVWRNPPDKEDLQMLAEDYLRIYISKIQKMQPCKPFRSREAISKDLLVVGGGVSGLTAALEAAQAGYSVHLVEKTDTLGGWLNKQYKSIPTKPPFRELEDPGIDHLVAKVSNNALITIHMSVVINEISGAPGFFDVSLKPEDKEGDLTRFTIGAVIQATGWRPTQSSDYLKLGESKDLIRNVDFEEIVKNNKRIIRPSDNKEVQSVAFIQCNSIRDKKQYSYCSSICCLTSLKQALYLRERNNQAKAYIFYEFMRTPGLYEDFYRRAQEDPGVFLTKGEVIDIERDEQDGGLFVNVKNSMPGPNIRIKADLVVLATGMAPNSADGEAIRALNDADLVLGSKDLEAKHEEAARIKEQLIHHKGTEILRLNYRQGPDLPVLQYGFPDSHFICFPYESRRTGVYPTGAVRQPMDGLSSREDATGAALKAIQCIEMTARGEAVHPRAGDKSYPDLAMSRCTQCKRCTEECPFGVLNEDDKGNPLLRETRCRRCGICMGACPERIVSFPDYSVNIIATMIKAVNIPDEEEEKPRILAFMCENDAMVALEVAWRHQLNYNPFVRVIPVRCLGSVNTVWITEAISAGFDGVLLIGCKYGDDYQCHFIKGSELADSRISNVKEKLEQMALENERVEFHQLQISEYKKLPEIFDNFAELIEQIGMNPFKGM